MSFTSFISKIFGNKSTRDLKEIEPIVRKIEALESEVKAMSVDELRDRISEIRADIAASVAEPTQENERLRQEVEELPFDERQPLWDKIDRNEKEMLDIIEERLNYHLPMVFAVVRETAARFAANSLASSAAGITANAPIAVGIGLAFCLCVGFLNRARE